MKEQSEPTNLHAPSNAPEKAEDGLALLIRDSLDNDPDFADVWAPLALLSKLIDERIRLGLSQAEVASRMGVARSAVAKLENDPDGVAFSRILSYARALGVELVPVASKKKPKAARIGRGRPINAIAASARKSTELRGPRKRMAAGTRLFILSSLERRPATAKPPPKP